MRFFRDIHDRWASHRVVGIHRDSVQPAYELIERSLHSVLPLQQQNAGSAFFQSYSVERPTFTASAASAGLMPQISSQALLPGLTRPRVNPGMRRFKPFERCKAQVPRRANASLLDRASASTIEASTKALRCLFKLRPSGLSSGLDKNRPDYTVFTVADGMSAAEPDPRRSRQSALVLVAGRLPSTAL